MRFKLNENLPVAAAVLLTQAGHDALTIYDQQMVGVPDQCVASVCHNEQRALITLDLDFADIRAYPPGDFAGMVVLRPGMHGRTSVLNLVGRLVALLAVETLVGNLWILDEFNLRVRAGERHPEAGS